MKFTGIQRISGIVSYFLGLVGGCLVILSCCIVYLHFFAFDKDRRNHNEPDNLFEDSFVNYRDGVHKSQIATGASNKIDLVKLVARFNTDFERCVEVRQQLKFADVALVLQLLDQSKQISGKNLRVNVQCEIFRRFASIDPTLALQYTRGFPRLERERLARSVLLERAFAEREYMEPYAQSLPRIERRIAVEAILLSLYGKSPQFRIAVARRLGWEELAHDLLEQDAIAKTTTDPAAAWTTLIDDSRIDANQIPALLLVAQSWIERDGMNAIKAMGTSLKESSIQKRILFELLSVTSRSNPAKSFEIARSIDGIANDLTILTSILRVWAEERPSEVLNEVSRLEDTGLRSKLNTTILQSWASREPRVLLETLEDFPPQLQDKARSQAVYFLAYDSPEEAATLLPAIADSSKHDVGFAIVTNWVRKDVRKAFEWLTDSPMTQQLRRYLLDFVWKDLVADDAEYAFQSALAVHSPLYEAGPEVAVLAHIAKTDIQLADSMLDQVRDGGVSKVAAYLEVGNVLVDTGKFDKAIELGYRLSNSDQLKFYRALAGRWASHDSIELLELIERFPNAESKSIVAAWVLRVDATKGNLTDQQIEYVNVYVSSKDREQFLDIKQ